MQLIGDTARQIIVDLHAALRLTPVMVVGALTLAACGSEVGGAASTTSGAVDPLAGRTFVSTSVTGHDLVDGTQVRLSFEDSQIRAQAGCNSLFGEYAVTPLSISVTQMGGTEMGCPPELMAQDEWLVEFLQGNPTWMSHGDNLLIVNGEVEMKLSDSGAAEPDAPVEGTTWQLETHVRQDTAVHMAAMDATRLTLVDGRAAVAAGCNQGSATYTLDGDQLVLGPLTLTRKMCGEQAMEVERLMTALLGQPLTVSVEGSQLLLTGADDEGLRLRVADSSADNTAP